MYKHTIEKILEILSKSTDENGVFNDRVIENNPEKFPFMSPYDLGWRVCSLFNDGYLEWLEDPEEFTAYCSPCYGSTPAGRFGRLTEKGKRVLREREERFEKQMKRTTLGELISKLAKSNEESTHRLKDWIPSSDDIQTADFSKVSKVHDWKNYVPDLWRNNWDNFSQREKEIIFVLCENSSNNEEWE